MGLMEKVNFLCLSTTRVRQQHPNPKYYADVNPFQSKSVATQTSFFLLKMTLFDILEIESVT